MAPEETTSRPPLRRMVPLQKAPDVTMAPAPLDTLVPSALPPAATASVPPADRTAPLAMPPDDRVSMPPLPIDRQRAPTTGFDEHLIKPVNLDRLAQIMSRGSGRDDALSCAGKP